MYRSNIYSKTKCNKTKEIMIDFRKSKCVPSTLTVNNSVVDSFKVLVIHITLNLSWSVHARYMCNKSQQRLYFLCYFQEISYETRDPGQRLSQYYRKHVNRVDNGMVWKHDL